MLDLNFILSYWQYILFGTVIIIGFIGYLIDKKYQPKRTFSYKEMPVMQPIRIPTKGETYWHAIWIWLTVTRSWTLVKDFYFELDSVDYVIPAGTIVDGASIPRMFWVWLNPVGLLLIASIVHDYGYEHHELKLAHTDDSLTNQKRKWFDQTFRDINIIVNGFVTLNYLAYYAVRLGGWVPWSKYKKNN